MEVMEGVGGSELRNMFIIVTQKTKKQLICEKIS